jgi:hypothetical protein
MMICDVIIFRMHQWMMIKLFVIYVITCTEIHCIMSCLLYPAYGAMGLANEYRIYDTSI